MRFSTWNTPRFISCYSEDLEWLHLPRGLTEQVDELAAPDSAAISSSFDDRPEPAPVGSPSIGNLRPQQAAAVEATSSPHDLAVSRRAARAQGRR